MTYSKLFLTLLLLQLLSCSHNEKRALASQGLTPGTIELKGEQAKALYDDMNAKVVISENRGRTIVYEKKRYGISCRKFLNDNAKFSGFGSVSYECIIEKARTHARLSDSTSDRTIYFYCKDRQEDLCEQRVDKELMQLGCQRMPDAITTCQKQDDASARSHIYCTAQGIKNCLNPYGDVGLTASSVRCEADATKKKIADKKISLTWSFGVFRSYVKHLCIE